MKTILSGLQALWHNHNPQKQQQQWPHTKVAQEVRRKDLVKAGLLVAASLSGQKLYQFFSHSQTTSMPKLL